MTIFAIDTSVHTNAALIERAMTLGYINGEVLDATYGTGRFWSNEAFADCHPVTNDLFSAQAQRVTHWLDANELHPNYRYDYTKSAKDGGFPAFWDNQFGTVILDSPYKLNGLPSQGGCASSDDSYGVGRATKWQDRMSGIYQGIEQCIRVLAPGGHLLIKCQDQVVSGKVRWQTIEFSNWAEINGCELVDMMHLVGSRPQPAGRRQCHSRRNYSTLLICKKDKA